MSDASMIAAALGLRPNRQGWSGNCPSCGYARTFSMSVRDGRAVWWCASCQDREGLLAAIRRAAGGAWPPSLPTRHGTANCQQTRQGGAA